MIIGIPKETKLGETRVALVPKAVKKLVQKKHLVLVEKSAGEKSGFTDQDYQRAGAKIVKTEEVYRAKMIVRVKRPQIKTLKTGQILLGYLHVEKNENPPLMKALLKKKITAYGYHLFKDKNQRRLINLGYEAGLVGAYESLRFYGKIQQRAGFKNDLTTLPSAWQCQSSQRIINAINLKIKIPLTRKPNIYILGNGLVAKGCRTVFNQIALPYFSLSREETKNMTIYLDKIDILINAVSYLPSEPHIITRFMLKKMKSTALIVDISCDQNGAIQTCKEPSWANPVYQVEGIYHFCVGNLPAAIGAEASTHLSQMVYPFVASIAAGEKLRNGLITSNGQLIYQL